MDERAKVQRHVPAGVEMLGKLDLRFPEVEECVRDHHERLDGSGYPQRKIAPDISHLARLCGLVDSYCAMVTQRPYAPAMEPMKAMATLMQDPGYDPELTRALQALVLTTGKRK